MADDLLPYDKRREPEYPEVQPRKYLTPKQKVELVKNQDGRCAICHERPRVFEYDHRVELWAGGTNDFANWQALCRGCHKDKSGAEAKHRAKMNRLRGKAGQVKRRKERGSLLKGRGFDKQRPLLRTIPSEHPDGAAFYSGRKGESALSKFSRGYVKRKIQNRKGWK